MKVAVFSTKSYDRDFLVELEDRHDLRYIEARLDDVTAPLAAGSDAVCLFVNDRADGEVMRLLSSHGVRFVVLRSAGFNHVDLEVARELGMGVARVPAYSPQAVAEHAVALMLALNRRIHRAYARVREGNFSLEGLLGFDMSSRTVGIVGTGQIGQAIASILAGFGCTLLAHDPVVNAACLDVGVEYVSLERLFTESDIVTLHCPLNPTTHHLVDGLTISSMKRGVMIINTSRGALIDTPAVIDGLKEGKIGHLGLDVYEEEGDLFFEDLSDRVITDDVFSRLLTFPNVIVTGHQAFFTREALSEITRVTGENLDAYARGVKAPHSLV